MNVDDALAIIDVVLRPKSLTPVQKLIFCQCWSDQTYDEIAREAGYTHDYVRKTGAQLWQLLSERFGRKITKSNLQTVLAKYQRQQQLEPNLSAAERADLVASSTISELELPTGQVPLHSHFYIDRPPSESLCCETIVQPGALIRIKAPRQMGKTSLMVRTLHHAQNVGLFPVVLNLKQAGAGVLKDSDRFLAWFCASVTRSLRLPNRLDEYWDNAFGPNWNSTDYFENYLLTVVEKGLAIALDDIDILFNYPELAADFLDLLRAWYEKAKYGVSGSEIWQKLRLVVVHSTEVYIPLDVNRSPFNVGLSIELQDFTADQVQDLAQRHGLAWSPDQALSLMAKVGGHPYLTRTAIYQLSQGNITLDALLQTAAFASGIYRDHLRRLWADLRQYPELANAYHQVVTSPEAIRIDPKLAYELESLGLIHLDEQGALPSYALYRDYFSDHLTPAAVTATAS
ncbi:MAG: serine/threonine protein kinase [Cyanothece sp. SIO1E1]|nr:serine/threonine protein kinase [Cyanothece sp. SIO1E1]